MIMGKTLLALFPLLLPVWEQRPFEESDFEFGPPPVYVETADLEFQIEGAPYVSPLLREKMFKQLGKSGNEEAVALLLEHLKQSDKPENTATILNAFLHFKDSSRLKEVDIKAHISATSPLIRRAAINLAGHLESVDNKTLLRKALEDRDVQVRINALEAVARRVSGSDREAEAPDFNEITDLRNSDNAFIRKLAWRISCHSEAPENHASKFYQACREGAVTVRAELAENLSFLPDDIAEEATAILKKDDNSSVRKKLAETLPALDIENKQAVLLELADDTDPEVRRTAVKSLKKFPEQEVAETLISLLADPSSFVGAASEESLVKIHPSLAIDGLAVEALESDNARRRYHAFRILAELGMTEHASAVAAALADETKARNIAAGLKAAFHVRAEETLSDVKELSGHDDASVRRGAAIALGMFDYDEAGDHLKTLLTDNSDRVRHKTIISMGRIGHAGFTESLLTVLKSVEKDHDYNIDCRMAACWAAACIRPVQTELADRLKRQAAKAIVKVPMGPPAYENTGVLVSAAFGLAEMARESKEITSLFKEVAETHSMDKDDAEGAGNSEPFPASKTLREYARQAKAFYNDEDIEPAARSKRGLDLIYQRID